MFHVRAFGKPGLPTGPSRSSIWRSKLKATDDERSRHLRLFLAGTERAGSREPEQIFHFDRKPGNAEWWEGFPRRLVVVTAFDSLTRRG